MIKNSNLQFLIEDYPIGRPKRKISAKYNKNIKVLLKPNRRPKKEALSSQVLF